MTRDAEAPQSLLPHRVVVRTKHVNAPSRPLCQLVMLEIPIPGLLQAHRIGESPARIEATANNLGSYGMLVVTLNTVAHIAIQRIFRKHPEHPNRRSNNEVHPTGVVRIVHRLGIPLRAGTMAVCDGISPSPLIADAR